MAQGTAHDHRARMLRALRYIEAHLDEDLSIEVLAAQACYSPYHFHRIFRGLVGESVASYVRRLRLERAASSLQQRGDAVTHVALEAGYSSHEAFSRAFKSHFGVSPSAYRHDRQRGATRLTITLPPRGASAMEASIEELPPVRVLAVRHVGPYHEVGRSYAELMSWTAARGIVPRGRFIGVSYDDPDVTAADKLRYDACLEISDDLEVDADGDVSVHVLAGGRFASTLHRGAFDRLGETYSELIGGWMVERGHEPAHAPTYEVHLSDQRTTAPEDYATQVYVPLKG